MHLEKKSEEVFHDSQHVPECELANIRNREGECIALIEKKGTMSTEVCDFKLWMEMALMVEIHNFKFNIHR